MVNKSNDQLSTRARLKVEFDNKYRSQLMEELNLSNINQVPYIEKVTVNVGLGKAKDDKKLLEVATNTILKITGQKPIETTAKKSIASFKLREGNKIGIKVTLRGEYMYEFIDRLINIVMPRLRDFHGVPLTSFDKNGNYSIGFKDQSVFPELSFEETSTLHGLQVNISVKNSTGIDQSKALLKKFGMPFEKEREN